MSDALLASAYRAAWGLARLVPERPAYAAGDRIADRVVRRGGAGVDRLRANLTRAVEDPDRLDDVVRAGMRSYVRYWLDAFRLSSWSTARRTGTVRATGAAPLKAALDTGRGAVAALAHLGNWDHAGAWAAVELGPVTSVAERLRPESVYAQFVRYRARIGIDVLPLTGGPDPVPELTRRLSRGAFVPLLADRDLTGRGVEVDLVGARARVAPGPALLAARTGAALHAVTCHYERRGDSPNGWGLVLDISPEIPLPDARGRTVRGAVQAYADHWSAAIRSHPEDWHMLQPVFTEDLR